jgi:hypothetical protein
MEAVALAAGDLPWFQNGSCRKNILRVRLMQIFYRMKKGDRFFSGMSH